MRKNQIIYFLNAVYYGIWTINMKFGDFIGRIVGAILSPVPKYFFSKSYNNSSLTFEIMAKRFYAVSQ